MNRSVSTFAMNNAVTLPPICYGKCQLVSIRNQDILPYLLPSQMPHRNSHKYRRLVVGTTTIPQSQDQKQPGRRAVSWLVKISYSLPSGDHE